jgi:predicted HicB family RNase H-like nuclease
MADNQTRITLRVPEDVYEWLRLESYKTRKSINTLIVEALQNEQERQTAVKDGK